jgi:hypothetical protein
MPDETEVETVSKNEHLKRIGQKNTRIEALEREVADWKAKAEAAPDADRLQRRLAKTQETYETLKADFDDYRRNAETERVLMAAGITDAEDMDLARYRWGRLDADNRPELADWLSDGARDDRHLRHLFADSKPAAEPEPASTATPQANGSFVRTKPNPLPNVNRGAAGNDGPPKSLTMEAILSMTPEERTDPKNREAVWAALRG